MTIFISGRITGDDQYKSKFMFAKLRLQARYPNAIVISPTDIDMTEFPYQVCMECTLAMIKGCSAVYFLKDWEASKGARAEHRLAEELGKELLYEQML